MTIYAIDFDGTCVAHEFPNVGSTVPGAVETLRELTEQGHELIIWTMRSGLALEDAKKWYRENQIPFMAANENPDQSSWTQSPKVYANVYIDDAALGCPLVHPKPRLLDFSPRPYVDWPAVRVLLGLDDKSSH